MSLTPISMIGLAEKFRMCVYVTILGCGGKVGQHVPPKHHLALPRSQAQMTKNAAT